MASTLFLAAAEAQRLLRAYGYEGDDAECVVTSETSMPEIIGRMIAAEGLDEAAIEACRAEQARLKLRMDRLARRIERRREEIATALESVGLTKLDCGSASVSIRQERPAVVITDADAIPADCKKTVTKTEISKALIKAKMDEGIEVPGATWSNPKTSLTIRRT